MEPIEIITVGNGETIDEIEGALKRAGYQPRAWKPGIQSHRGSGNTILIFAGSRMQIVEAIRFCESDRIPMIQFVPRKTNRLLPKWKDLKFAIVKNPKRKKWVELIEAMFHWGVWDERRFHRAKKILRRKE